LFVYFFTPDRIAYCLACLNPVSMTYGLFVGINRYSPAYYGSGNDLSQCIKDAERLRDTASRIMPQGSIKRLLVDERATAEGWLSEMDKLASEAKKGDVVLLTQSSHGTTHYGFEGVASGLCFYDRIVWDSEVNRALQKFRSGVTVVRISDSCYSESTYRLPIPPNGDPTVRGRSMPCPEHAVPPQVRGRTKAGHPTRADNRKIRCALFDYSACLFDQVAYEDMNGGAWTTSLLARLNQTPLPTYLGLFKESPKMPFPQNPTFETVRGKKRLEQPFLSV
jgi:hypothetical protein